MHENPCIEVLLPMRQGAMEIAFNLSDSIGRSDLGRAIYLEEHALRLQIAIILSVAYSAPRPACHEVAGMRLRHYSDKEVLKGCGLCFQELCPEPQFVVCGRLLVVHARILTSGIGKVSQEVPERSFRIDQQRMDCF